MIENNNDYKELETHFRNVWEEKMITAKMASIANNNI